jgi:hypothetical protein
MACSGVLKFGELARSLTATQPTSSPAIHGALELPFMKLRFLTLLGFIIILVLVSSASEAHTEDRQIRIEELVLSNDDFLIQPGTGLNVSPDGLALNDTHNSSTYTSAPIPAPISFNAVVPEWLADTPEASHIEIYLRTGRRINEWGDWQHIHPSLDWTLPDEKNIVGDMVAVPALDVTHNYVQFQVSLNRDKDLISPLLREMRLVFIDSTAGPSVEDMIAEQKLLDGQNALDRHAIDSTVDSYPKPFVISRDVWCTDPRCDYSDGLEYQPVTHLILHHTVSGSNGDSAALVRAVWAFHTINRGWGDIGYNYLADTEGVIFEGHLGGDDVVGIHARAANAGSMALALIGTYSVTTPPPPMLEAAVDLFAWKADQKNIDVFEASNTLPNVPYGLPHLMGHRDVEGTTQCPGDVAHALLPAIRDEVAKRIGLVSPYLVFDELSSAFVKSSANWYTAQFQCGYNTHAWYTWSTTNPSNATNWGEWRPAVPVDGRYRIDAYIPYCNTGKAETGGASYTIQHANGSSTITGNQNANVGLWMPLGEFDLRAGSGNVIRLTDLTTSDDWLGVWFDAIRLLKLETIPTAVNQSPADGSWSNQREILFQWHIEHPEQVAKTTFQVAADEQFQNIISTKEWPAVVESVPHTFDQDYAALYWRVTTTAISGSGYSSIPSRFGIDTEAPVSAVNALIWLEWSQQYLLTWQGEDALSGIDNYTVEYLRLDGGGNIWQPLIAGVNSTTAFFSPPDPNAVYAFRSQAMDVLGNMEPARETADITSDQAIFLSHAIIHPVILAD